MAAASWWKCAWCASPPPSPPAASVAGVPSAPLLLKALPTSPSPLSPLVFVCGQCAQAMVQCESCWALVQSVEQPAPGSDGRTGGDGVSACRRCGFLSVERASVRALLQLPPRRDADGTLWRVVPLAEDARLQQHLNDLARKLEALKSAVTSEDVDAPDNELAQLQRQWYAARQASKQLATERERALRLEPAPMSSQSVQQSFSTTQLHFLRVMYESTAEHTSLMDAVPAVERFLASQPTLLQMKFDLLAAYRAHVLSELLTKQSLMNGKSLDGGSTSDAISMATSYWEAQLQHRWSEFQAHANRHLPVVATVNGFLRPLYKAASDLGHSLQRPSGDNSSSVVGVASPVVATSPMSRKRRRFSGPRSAMAGAVPLAVGQGAKWRDSEVAGVQRQLELNSQVADAAKKVELWRALAFAVSSAAVVSIEELVDATARS